MYTLSFGMYFLLTWCTREWYNRFGRTPNCRDSRINHIMFRTLAKPRRPEVRCTNSALVCTCTHGVQEKGAIGLVELQTAEIQGLICFAIHFLRLTIE